MFITAFTKSHHPSFPWARLVHSTSSHLMPLWSILILSSHIRLDLPSCFFPSGFLAEILYTSLFSTVHGTFLAHFVLGLFVWILFGENWKSRSSSFCSFLLHILFLDSHVVLSTLFTNTPSQSVYFSFDVRDHDTFIRIKQKTKL